MNSPTLHEQIRNDQIRLGRRISVGDTSYKPGYSHKSPFKPAAPKKPSGHEAFLKALETAQAEIVVRMLDELVYIGTVKHSDKYTISIRPSSPTSEDDNNGLLDGTVVLFKHAIQYFQPTQPAPAAE